MLSFPRLILSALLTLASASFATAGERERAITDALIWTGLTERVARGRLDANDGRAIARFERRVDGYPDGRLDRREEAVLLRMADARRSWEGYERTLDARTGARIGLPTAWFGRGKATSEGTRWRSPDGAITVETFRSARGLANRRAREASRGGEITYRTGGRNWFVLSGYRNGNPYYVRAAARGSEVRGYRVQYDPSLRQRLDRVVVAMSSDFQPFAGHPTAQPLEAAPAFALLPRTGPDPQQRPVELAALEPLGPTEPRATPQRPVRADPKPDPANAPIPPLGPDFAPNVEPEREEVEREEATPAPARPGLEPLSDAPVPDTGEETEDAVPSEITGMLTDEGQSCPTLRAADGSLYAMIGEIPSVEPGTLVTIQAQAVDSERCSAGRTVAVSGFRVRSLR